MFQNKTIHGNSSRDSSIKFNNPIPRRKQYDEKSNYDANYTTVVKENQIFERLGKFFNDWSCCVTFGHVL